MQFGYDLREAVKSEMKQFDIGRCSVIGTREEQQDASILIEAGDRVFAAVCDGMGGLYKGAVAANTAIMTLERLYRSKPREQAMDEFYMVAVDILDESVFELRRENPDRQPSGTTIVSAGICGNCLHWLSVGDSRLYIARGKEIVCATTDHNYLLLLNNAVKTGEISPEEYKKERKKGDALISYIGMGGVDLMDCSKTPFILRQGDVVVLTSDGLYRCVTEREISGVVNGETTAQETAEALVALAKKNSAREQDNTTVLVIKYKGES